MRTDRSAARPASVMACTPHGARAGFTLVELLVAITVLAMVAVLGWRGLDSILRSRIAITEDIEQTHGMQLMFAQLESDCARIAPSSLVGNRPTLLAQDGRLLLVRAVFADDAPTRVQTVDYRLADGRLTRRESVPTRDLAALDASWREARADAPTHDAIVMQSAVVAMSTRVWTNDRIGWQAASVLAQAPRAVGATPVSVEGLEVTFALQSRPGKLTKIFLLGSA